jgi:hypothetical protein
MARASVNERMWLDTPAMLDRLGIGKTTLFLLKKQGTLLKGRHWTRKNPALPRSSILWHIQRCEMALDRL